MNKWILLILILILCVMCPLLGIPALVIFFMVDLAQTLIELFSSLWKVIGGGK